MPGRSRFARSVPNAPAGRKLSNITVRDMRGLNSTDPYGVLEPYSSPFLRNVRMYKADTERQVSISTREGAVFYTVPIGEASAGTQTNTTGAADRSFDVVNWFAQKFTVSTAGILSKLELNLKKGTGTSPITVKICEDATGSPGNQIAISTIPADTLTTSYGYKTAYFVEGPSLSLSTDYWIVISVQETGSDIYFISTTTNTSLGKTSLDAGKTWSSLTASGNYKVYTATSGPVKGMTRFYPPNNVPVTFFAHGNNIYSVNDSTGATTTQKSGLNAAATKVRFAQLNNAVYAANGYDALQRSTGTTFSSVSLPVSITPRLLCTHKAKLFAVDATDKNLMRWSEENDYTNWLSTSAEYVPESNYASGITALLSFQDNLVIFTEDNKFVMYGDVSDDFVFRQAIGNRGAVSQEAVVADENFVYFVADDGHLYRWNGSRDEQLSRVIQSDLDNVANFENVKLSLWNNRIYYWFQSTGSTKYDSCFVYETRYNQWFYDTGRFMDNALALVQEDDTAIFASDHYGALYKSTDKYSDLGRPIDFKYHTNYFDFGAPNNYKQVRRVYLQFRTSTWNGDITVSTDTDFLNDPTIEKFNVTTKGFNWGSFVWGNPNYVWGQNTQFVRHRTSVPGQATNFQIRVEKYGAETPIYFMGFSQYYRLRRPA